MKNIDIDIDIDKEILENIDIDNEILENINIDKISNRLELGISNRASVTSHQMFQKYIICSPLTFVTSEEIHLVQCSES